MTDSKTSSAQAHGLVYPFEAAPSPQEKIEVAAGVFWVRLPFPFGNFHINLWLIRDGEGWTLVDTGMDHETTREVWEGWIENLLEGLPILRVIVTHMHPDHVGLAGWIVKKFEASFYMSRTDYLMCRAMAADTGLKAPEEGVSFYHEAGFDEKGLGRYRERFGSFGEWIFPLPQSYGRLRQGDEITIGGYAWQIEVGMGHTPEHLVLFCPALKVLISGDQILPKISSNVSLFPTEPNADPLKDWMDSCLRLKDIFPDDTLVLPAHNEPFYGVKNRLQSLYDSHERALARLLGVCDVARRAVDQEVFSVLFKRKIDRDNFFMATGESLAHLSCLVYRGAITRELDADGVAWFQKV